MKLTEKAKCDRPREKLAAKGAAALTDLELLAAFELARRYLPPQTSVPIVLDAPDKIFAQFAAIRHKQQEHFVVLTLDGAARLIARRTVFIGTLNASLVHPREVFADAITDRATSVIVGHNHPSGSLEPSPADRETTRRLAEAGHILGIPLVDHFIITPTAFRSIL